MPSRFNPQTGQYERISFEESVRDAAAHVNRLNAAGVKWEDLDDPEIVDQKLRDLDQRTSSGP